jgi:hypothetical protein
MPAATQSIDTPERPGSVVALPVAAATKLFAGTLGAVNSAGNAVSAADAVGLVVFGRVEEDVDNSGGIAGAKTVRVRNGVFRFQNSATSQLNQSHVMKTCYVEDNQTVRATGGTNSIRAGLVLGIEGDGVWVDTRLAAAL